MNAKPVTTAKIKAPIPNQLDWSIAMFRFGQRLRLVLETENPRGICPVEFILTGIDDVPGTNKLGFKFRGRFVNDKATRNNLAVLGLPAQASFEATIDFTYMDGKLTVVDAK
jgi:hypothetical protein